MKYFMIVWESRNDRESISNKSLCELLEKHVGKISEKKTRYSNNENDR